VDFLEFWKQGKKRKQEKTRSMLKIDSPTSDLNEYMKSFIWTFKISDNIIYNLNLIVRLVRDHNNLQGRDYNKPILILCVSVIEAMLVDFLERLDSATRHFPSKLSVDRENIKAELNRKQCDFQSIYEGQVYKYKRLQNFGYKDLIEFYEHFHLLGKSPLNYRVLQDLGRFRNRVHIRNYFSNFERDESQVFSERRTQAAINIMVSVFKYLSENYPRP
jgi:hypothetical protein